jgi:2',3'-cyclic-nucleotide 2'-phosphodiesterase (5'-nucleotidase family)
LTSIRILHTNDFHGHLSSERAAFLSSVRAGVDLYFDCGDLIRTGNLGVPVGPDPAWTLLSEIGCDASVPGNRETHVLESIVRRKVEGARHSVLAANWRTKAGELAFADSRTFDVRGLRVGVFGVMVPMVTARMKSASVSQYLWSAPLEVAAEMVRTLRGSSDVVIALTHIGLTQDRLLAESVEGVDIILGGHSHDVLKEPIRVGSTWIAQTGSHGRFAGVYAWDGSTLSGELASLPAGR